MANFRGLVLCCIEADFCNHIITHFWKFQHFSRSKVAHIGAKKRCKHFSSPRKKGTFGGFHGRGGRPRVNLGSTLGQPWVSSLAISGRFSLILPDSSIKTEDRRTCISQMVDFPIRKRDFRVRTWSGAFWEPLESKRRKPIVFTRSAFLRTAPNSEILQKIAKLFLCKFL